MSDGKEKYYTSMRGPGYQTAAHETFGAARDEAIMQATRNAALEEAAKVAEGAHVYGNRIIAAAIRELKAK